MRILLNAMVSIFVYSCAYSAPVPHRMITHSEPWSSYVRALYPQGIKLNEEISLFHQNIKHLESLFEEKVAAKKMSQEKKELLLIAIEGISEANQGDARINNPFKDIFTKMSVSERNENVKNNAESVERGISASEIKHYYNNLETLKTLFNQKNDSYLAYYDLSEFIAQDFDYKTEKKSFIHSLRSHQKGETPVEMIVGEMENADTKMRRLRNQAEERSVAFKNLVKFQTLTLRFRVIFGLNTNA